MNNLQEELTLVTIGYNSEGVIEGHFNSYIDSATQALPRWVFVDNASRDSTDQIMPRYLGKVEFHKNEKNLGFGTASNIGIHSAKTRYVLVLNPVTQLSEQAIDELLTTLKAEDAGIVGPNLDGSAEAGIVAVDWLVGAVLLMDKQKMDAVGYFDEDFFLYEEDVDICKRANDAGLKVLHCFDISIPHVGGGSTARIKKVNEIIHYHKGRSYVLFNRKHNLPEENIQRYLAKNKRRCWVAIFTFGPRRYLRARAKIEGVMSAI